MQLRYKIPIGCLSVFAIAVVALLMLIPAIRRVELANRIERDYQALRESNKSKLYAYYPEILDRVVVDATLAERIKVVCLTSTPTGDYSALARFPNIAEVQVMYSHDVDRIIPTINQMPSLKSASFAYCYPTREWLYALNNPSLQTLQIHGYNSDVDVEVCQKNMPRCTIKITTDEDYSLQHLRLGQNDEL